MVLEDLSKSNKAVSATPEAAFDDYVAALPSGMRECIVEGDRFGPCFDHPFFYMPGFKVLALSGSFPVEKLIEAIAASRTQYEKLCAEGDFESALSCVYKPHRRQFLLNLIREHGVDRLYSAIRSVWISVDFFSHDHWLWCEVWEYVRESEGGRSQVIHADDCPIFDALPDELTVYRGFQREEGGEEYGWSWSLNRETAEWFARRWPNGEPMIATMTVNKSDVLAYFNDRNEAEIVLHPEELNEMPIEALSKKRAAA